MMVFVQPTTDEQACKFELYPLTNRKPVQFL